MGTGRPRRQQHLVCRKQDDALGLTFRCVLVSWIQYSCHKRTWVSFSKSIWQMVPNRHSHKENKKTYFQTSNTYYRLCLSQLPWNAGTKKEYAYSNHVKFDIHRGSISNGRSKLNHNFTGVLIRQKGSDVGKIISSRTAFKNEAKFESLPPSNIYLCIYHLMLFTIERNCLPRELKRLAVSLPFLNLLQS